MPESIPGFDKIGTPHRVTQHRVTLYRITPYRVTLSD
jgi:hypothetical protein